MSNCIAYSLLPLGSPCRGLFLKQPLWERQPGGSGSYMHIMKKEKKGEKTVFFSAVYWGLVPLTLSATQRNVSQVGVPRIRIPAY